MSWIEAYRGPGVNFRVYSKGEAAPGAEALKNVGRESHTFLTHIVENYDRLADWTVFTQGAAPTWGYKGGDSGSGHLTDHISFGDYLKPFPNGRDSFLAMSAAVSLPQGLQSTRLGSLTDKLSTVSNDVCPAGGADGWSGWWLDPAHPHARAGAQMLAFYKQHVLQKGSGGAELTKPVTLAFVQGARFAVAAKRILTRPRAFYEKLLSFVSQERSPIEGYFLEAMWHDVFHPEAPQDTHALCSLMPLPVAPPLTASEMYEDTARRLNDLGLATARVLSQTLSEAYVVTSEAPGTEAPGSTESTEAPGTTEAPGGDMDSRAPTRFCAARGVSTIFALLAVAGAYVSSQE
uniref:Uncharacterized protein n=1 Tax=Zooxanthella nutricula TaxID=1333877 RepID=A0A6U6VLJ9_9DINO